MSWFADKFLTESGKEKILDVGSYDVNGNYRSIFESKGKIYTGLDMTSGPNVDIVPKHAYAWDEIEDNTYDIVISGQALEHIEFFWITMAEIVRVTKKDGLICIIAPNGFEEHRYPVDCWRFFTDGMIAMARFYKLKLIHAHTNAAPKLENESWYSIDMADSMLIAKKEYSGNAQNVDIYAYECEPTDHERVNDGFISYKAFLKHKENIHAEQEIRKSREKRYDEPSKQTKLSMIKVLAKNLKKLLLD